MIRSMTGFGRATAAIPGGQELTVDISAVNHRHQEFSIRLPQQWQFAEHPVRNTLRQRIHRGKITVSIRPVAGSGSSAARIDENTAVSYLRAYQKIVSIADLPLQPLTFRDLAMLPHVLVYDDGTCGEETITETILAAMAEALDMLDHARSAEGACLAADMRTRCETLLKSANSILDRSPEFQEAYLNRMRQRLEELAIEPGIREDRLAMECVLLADRLDITEEAVRLKTHLNRFLELLESDGPVGRELGFLIQEIHREINTMGAKLRDIDCITETLWMKSEVEKIREQIQNIE